MLRVTIAAADTTNEVYFTATCGTLQEMQQGWKFQALRFVTADSF